MKQKQWEQLREGLAGGVGEVLLYLTACALHETVPDGNIYTGVDEELLYLGAKSHTIVSMVAYALEKNGYQGISKETADKFRTGRDKAVRKNMLLNAEREAVLSHLEQAEVRYLPLKGVVLQKLYPDFGMRQMADNDILYDVKYQMKLKDFMEDRGFRAENVGSGVHDCYYKEPVYNYEMHTQLFADTHKDGVAAEYYRDIWSRAVRDTDKKYGYHFTDEDFYVYVTAHAEKHHEGAGTGVRTLADVYVMLRAFEGADRKYIQEQLDKLGISEFERKVRFLAKKLLSDPQNDHCRSPCFTCEGAFGTSVYPDFRYIRDTGEWCHQPYEKIGGKGRQSHRRYEAPLLYEQDISKSGFSLSVLPAGEVQGICSACVGVPGCKGCASAWKVCIE